MKLAIVEKKTFLAGLQCTLTSSCAIIIIIIYNNSIEFFSGINESEQLGLTTIGIALHQNKLSDTQCPINESFEPIKFPDGERC